MEHKDTDQDEEGWKYGEDWKQGSPDDAAADDDVQYVEVLRGDLGSAYDDSFMLDLVSYLGSRGVRATYDAFSIGMEFGVGAAKTYVLKVELGKEDEARAYLREKLKE